MTNEKSKISTSDINVDSKILDMDICSDEDDNWFIRIEKGYYMTEDGDVVEVDKNGKIPSEAIIDNIVKSQQLVQEYNDDIKIPESNREESQNKNGLEDSSEKESQKTGADENDENFNDIESSHNSSSDIVGEEFGVDKMEDNRPKSNNSEEKRNSLSDNIDEYDEDTQSFVSQIKSRFSDDEPEEENQSNRKDSDDDTHKNSSNNDSIFSRFASVFDRNSDTETKDDRGKNHSLNKNQNKDKSDNENNKNQNESGDSESILSRFTSMFEEQDDKEENKNVNKDTDILDSGSDLEDNNLNDGTEGMISRFTSMFEEQDDKEQENETDNKQEQDDKEQENETDNKQEQDDKEQENEVSVPLLMALSFFVPPAAYYYLGEKKLSIINLLTINFLGIGLFIVPAQTYMINKTEKDEIDRTTSDSYNSEDSDTISDHTKDEEDEIDTNLIELVTQFLSADIADVNQRRPDAQNVSINYIEFDDDGVRWSDTIKQFWSKLRKSKSGDEIAQKDLGNDVWTRYIGLIKRNSYARGDLLDLIFTSILTLIGVILIFAGILSTLTGSIGSLEALTQPSGYADQIVITTILLSIVSISLWLSRRIATKTVVSAIRKPIRISALTLLALQFGVASVVVYTLTLGGGQEALKSLELMLDSYVEPLISSIPLESLSETAMRYYEQIRGPETSLFGINIIEASVFMSLVGSITAYPVLKRSIARMILTTNMDPREFREETGILVEQLSDAEKDYNGPKYVMGGGGTVNETDGGSRTVTAEDKIVRIDSDEEKEGLLALPDHIKGSPFADYEEVRRYWVRPPYAYVSIVYNERQNDYRYVVVEPELDESEKAIFDELKKRLDTVLLLEDVEEKEDYEKEVEIKLEKLENTMIELSQEYNIDINDETFHRLMYFVEREYVYYNKIDPLINDPNVEDISCDGEDKYIFVFHSDYKDIITNVKFQKDELRSFIQELAQRSGEHISAADPMVDASLPDGSRAQMTLGSEVTTKGSTFTIRLFEDIPFTPVDLLDYDTFSLTQMAYLWTAIEHNKSLIFAGGTASGKTTSMNAVSMFIPPKAKVITIEDTREISLPQENWIPGTTREGVGGEEGGDDIDMYELLRAALRQRPEYIVVGEIRGKEAETLFQAMNTGHTTYSTMHAETVDAAIGRLTNPPINVPKQMITALDIICIQNQIRFTDDNGDVQNVRRNEETREIVGLRDNGQFQNRRPFQWDAETDTFIQSLEDSYVLSRISEENGWTPEDKEKELKEREEVLEYMLEENIREFEYVSNIIQAYMVDSEKIVREVRNDTLKPDDLKSLTDMEWEEPERTLSDMSGSDMPQIEGDTQ